MYLAGGPTRSWLKTKYGTKAASSWVVSSSAPRDGASKGLVRSTSPFSGRVPVRGVTGLGPSLVAEVTYGEVKTAGVYVLPCFAGSR
jgi:hypothetical protein